MSDTTPPPAQPKPRIIVELQPDGSLVMESYVDGNRKRLELQLGFEAFEIKEELRTIARRNLAQAERKAAAKREMENKRHSQVWRYVAENHGVGFANRTVNGTKSSKLHAKVDEKPQKANPTVKEMLALL